MTKIKICGLKTQKDVEAVNLVIPEYVGFVFAHSKRHVTDEQAAQMKKALLPEIQTVGVFVNEPIAHVVWLCRKGIIDLIQLHGDETAEYATALKRIVANPVIRAIRVQSRQQMMEQQSYPCDFFLYDTYQKDSYGGTGKTFDRSMIPPTGKPYFLAGGLQEDNVIQAIKECNPYCVDVSSGVETDGNKDKDKIMAFVKRVRKESR